MENKYQDALNNLKCDQLNCVDRDKCNLCGKTKSFETLQELITNYSVLEKALDIISKQYSGYIREIGNLPYKFDIGELLKESALEEALKKVRNK